MKELVRISNTDIKGGIPIFYALQRITGVSYAFSNGICRSLGLDEKKKIGLMSEEELKHIEQLIKNPQGLPVFLLNRRKDVDTGADKHLTGHDLRFQKEIDIRRMKKTKSYKGMRHAYGLPVRGQRTKGNFRTGLSVGVMKKKGIQQAAAPEKKEKK